MALTTRTLPALMNGISRQPAILRSPDQMEDELNTFGKIATGLSRRPPTTVVKKLTGLSLGDATLHHINRDISERYTVIIDTGSIKVFDETTGTEKTVTAPAGWGYLDAAGSKYRAITIADYTFIVNTEKVVDMKAVGADEAAQPEDYYLGGTAPRFAPDSLVGGFIMAATNGAYQPNPVSPGVTTGVVASMEKLPDPVCSGCVYQVKGAQETSFVSYYVMGDGSVWNETVAPGMQNSLDETTMPHALVRKADGTFEFGPFSWQPRRVGDHETNPVPPFVGRSIRDVVFYQNRLGFLSDESITLSTAGDLGDFWRRTVLDYIDSDALAAAIATQDVNVLDYAIPFADGIMLFSRQRQFSLTNGDSGVSAHSIAIQPVTSYVMSPEVRPVPLGSQVHFTTDSHGYTAVQEYTRLAGSDPTEAADITAHVPDLIPTGVSSMASASDLDAVFLFARNAPAEHQSKMWVYQFFWDGDRKLQSAWRVWDFGDGKPRSGAYESGALHILMERPDGFYIEKMDLQPGAKSDGQDHLIYLDRGVKKTGTYSAVTNKTTFALGYTPDVGATVRAVRTNTASIPESLVNPAKVTVSGSNVIIDGDESAAPLTIGQTYESRVAVSRQFPVDWQGKPMTTGRLQLHNFTVSVLDTVYALARVYPYGKRVAELHPDLKHESVLSGFVLGTPGATLGQPSYYTGPFTFSVASNAAEVWIEVINDSPFSSTFTSAEWEGLFHHRAL